MGNCVDPDRCDKEGCLEVIRTGGTVEDSISIFEIGQRRHVDPPGNRKQPTGYTRFGNG